MSWSDFQEYMRKPTHGPLAIVAGAGIHCVPPAAGQSQEKAQDTLASWDGLLGVLDPGDAHKHVPATIRWELLSLARGDGEFGDLSAQERVHHLQDEVCQILKDEEDSLWNDVTDRLDGSDERKGLRALLHHPRVTDLVSLNVDLALERMVGIHNRRVRSAAAAPKGGRRSAERRLNGFREWSPQGLPPTRFWHPHGDRKAPRSTVFGLWGYRKRLEALEEARRLIKEEERRGPDGMAAFRKKVETSPENWYEVLLFRPLLFVGTSLDAAEWDLWSALVSRWRNFGKSKNRKHQAPAWILTRPGHHPHLPASGDQAIKRLEEDEWSAAWKQLGNPLDPSRHSNRNP